MTRILAVSMLFLAACKGDDGAADDSAPTDDSSADDSSADDSSAQAVSWANDVWPILEDNCAGCHADDSFHPGYKLSDAATAYTALTTDTPDNTEKGFSNYVVPGDPGASLIVDKLQDVPLYGGERMPKGGELNAADIATITTWISEGAANN